VGDNRLEVEVKFIVSDLADLRQRLLAAGGEQVRPRIFERNVRFDTPGETLRTRFQLLRLRQDDRVRLTFKGPVDNTTSEAKVREEIEVEVADFGTMGTILKRVGFVAHQVYEKYRETFRLGEVEVVLDELPFGDFVELEGAEAAIRAAAGRLGLAWEERVLINYLGLFSLLRERYTLSFADLTFENFADLEITASDLLDAPGDLAVDLF